MGPTINLRIKTQDTMSHYNQTKYEVRAVDHNLLAK